jgi:6-phosphogluconolactonase
MMKGILAGALLTVAVATASAAQYVYVATNDRITAFVINPETGALTESAYVELLGAGPMRLSHDSTKVYAVAQQPADRPKDRKPAIATFSRTKDGKLTQLNVSPINLRPGYLGLDATGRFLAGNHYGPGKITVWAVDKDGVCRGKEVWAPELEPKAHSATFSPDNKWLLVPATAPNKVFVNKVDAAAGAFAPNDPPFGVGPQGDNEARQPRHLVFHPKLPFVYTTNERENPGVGAWAWDTAKGTLKSVQSIVTLPDNFTGRISTADLHLTPDGKFLYVSNRDNTDRKSMTGRDEIVGFSVDPKSGRLTLTSRTSCERVPRSFCLDASGSFVYVAGQGDGKLGAYRIDKANGALRRVGQYDVGGRPIWVMTAQ